MKLLTDRPFTAIKGLTAALVQTATLFDKQGNEISNNPSAKMLSQNGSYFAKVIEFRFRRNDGQPLAAADFAFLAVWQQNTKINLLINRGQSWDGLLAGLSEAPLGLAANNYNVERALVSRYIFNVPNGLVFGKNVTFDLTLQHTFLADPSAYCNVVTFRGIEELEAVEKSG
jgi:hypothetical protein